MNKEEKFIQEMYAASMERTIKRLWITIILLIVLLVGTNVGWLIYESQFEEVTTTQTVTQDLQGDNASNNFIGGDVYGKSETDSNNSNQN